MGAESKIEWTDTTWNPVRGCSRVSPGCDNCYAMRQAHRFNHEAQDGARRGLGAYDGLTTIRRGKVDWSGRVRLVPEMLGAPLRWRKPRRVFVNSMSDLFHESLSDEQIAAVFGAMACCSRHTFQVLTKRAKRMREWIGWADGHRDTIHHAFSVATGRAGMRPWDWPLPNVWLGVSAEDQQRADERIPDLLATPAAVRFVSAEPLLGPIDLSRWLGGIDGNPEECRGRSISSGRVGRDSGRRRWPDLARGCAPLGPLDETDEVDPVHTATGREALGRVPASSGDDRRQAGSRACASAGVAALQGHDSGRADGEPQERAQDRQSPGQLGARDARGTDAPRDGGAGIRPDSEPALSWVIVGGESGVKPRPMRDEWVRQLRDECAEHGVKFFYKQRVDDGKKISLPMLDGRQWAEFPR